MSLNMPITKRKVRNHFQYHFWKYLLLVVLAIFGWNLLYTSTRYQSPDNLKVEFYAEGSSFYGSDLQTLADTIHQEIMPEMEEVTATVTTYDDTYGDMQLIVWVSAGQGDIYLLSNDRFKSLAQNEALLDLAPYIESGALQVGSIDLSEGYQRIGDAGEKQLVGIPADTLTTLADYGLLTEDATLCVLANNGNDKYSIMFLNYLLTHMQGDGTSDAAAGSDSAAVE